MPENYGMALVTAGMILFILYAILISYYHSWWERIDRFEPSPVYLKPMSLSVIIPARNEEKNLPRLLNKLSLQTYPRDYFEVIVVDDGSVDNTAAIARGFENVSVVSLEGGSKKKAIEKGIEVASGELIVTTDADCLPGPNWLQSIAAFYNEHDAAFIAAPVAYFPRKGLLPYFQTLDFLTLQGITAASVSSGFHSMCNGANLAYKRSAFYQVEGFTGIDHVASGDDMLLMHKIRKAFPAKVKYMLAPEAIVETAPMSTWKEFFWQRMRWASKSSHYGDPKIMLSLLLVLLLNLYFFVLVIAAFWDIDYLSIAAVAWIAKFAIELPFVHSVAKFYKQQYLIPWFFLMQPLHIVYTVVVAILSQFSGYYWKGRRLK